MKSTAFCDWYGIKTWGLQGLFLGIGVAPVYSPAVRILCRASTVGADAHDSPFFRISLFRGVEGAAPYGSPSGNTPRLAALWLESSITSQRKENRPSDDGRFSLSRGYEKDIF